MTRYLSIATVLAFTATCSADVATYFEKVNTLDIGGITYKVYDMMVDVDSDWEDSSLIVSLTTGTLYQDPGGSDVEFNPVWLPFFPNLEWDTYVTVPGGFPATPFVTDHDVSSDWFDISWFDMRDTGPGLHKVARITFSSDAEAYVMGETSDVDTAGVPFGFQICDGDIAWGPKASTLDQYEIDVGQSLILDARQSSSFAWWYLWDLDNDGDFETNAGMLDEGQPICKVSYQYLESLGLGPAEDPYPIRLKVMDLDGRYDITYSTLRIIPEPATLSVLVLGGLLVLRRRRRASGEASSGLSSNHSHILRQRSFGPARRVGWWRFHGAAAPVGCSRTACAHLRGGVGLSPRLVAS